MDRFINVFPPVINSDYQEALRHLRKCEQNEREAMTNLESMARELEPLLAKEEREGLTVLETLTRDSLYEATAYFLSACETAVQRAAIAEQLCWVYEDFLPLEGPARVNEMLPAEN